MSTTADKPTYNRKNPCIARLKETWELTVGCEEKDTRHFTIDLADSGLEYLPGDSLAVLPENCPEVADALLAQLGFSGDEPVTPAGAEAPKPIRAAFIENCVITTPDKKIIKAIAEKTGDAGASLAALLDPEKKAELSDYLWGREIIDLLAEYPTARFEPQEFVDLLKKLNIRLYSISSSLQAHPAEVHLTVATVEYQSHGRQRKGVCSTWLAQRIDEDTTIPCFISPGKGFRLPEPDDATPIVMVGPGTGIAPFRAFLEHRKATAAQGKAWLFFGEIHEASTYFYRDEFEAYLADGTLERIDTAFSRDQAEKVYVQHRILEAGEELYKWLEDGAIVYVCGDAARMAGDVDKALHQVIAEQGGKSAEEAAAYVEQMKADKRYRRDVY